MARIVKPIAQDEREGNHAGTSANVGARLILPMSATLDRFLPSRTYSSRIRGSRRTYMTSESSTPTMNMMEAITTLPMTTG